MRIKGSIDRNLQESLAKAGISFPLDPQGRIAVCELRIDEGAKMCMAYLRNRSELPRGELPFHIPENAPWVLGVFHLDGEAVIIELGTAALEAEDTGRPEPTQP